MPSQRGNREQGFSSDEDSANDSSFEKIDLDSDNEIIDKDAQDARAALSDLEKKDREGVDEMLLTMKNHEVQARFSKPSPSMLKGQVAFNIMDPIGEQLEKEIKKEAEVKRMEAITNEADPDHWHEVKGQEEESEREMVKADEWKGVSDNGSIIEEVDAGEMDMDISEDDEEVPRESEDEELILDVTQAMEDGKGEEESEDVELMLDVTQEVEEKEEDALERTAIEIEEEEKKEDEKEKKAEKKLKPTVTRGEILSTFLFILLMCGASYECVVFLRPTKYYETFEIFRGPTNQDGSTQEFITLPLDMVKKLLAGAEDSAALKKKVERLESEATEYEGNRERLVELVSLSRGVREDLKAERDNLRIALVENERKNSSKLKKLSDEITQLKLEKGQLKERLKQETKKVEQEVREEVAVHHAEMTRIIVAEKNAEIEALETQVQLMNQQMNEEKNKTGEFRKLTENCFNHYRGVIARKDVKIEGLVKRVKQMEEKKNNVAAQCNGEAAKKSDQLEKKVEKSYTIRLSAEPPAPESAKERIQEWIDDLSAMATKLEAKMNEKIKCKEMTWEKLMLICAVGVAYYALKKTLSTVLWKITVEIRDLLSTGLPKNGATIKKRCLFKTEAGYGFALKGRIVSKILAGSAAEREGLRVGDEILAVNWVNVETTSVKKIREMIGAKNQVHLHVRQNPCCLE